MTQLSDTPSEGYRSTEPGVGDHQAVAISEPATFQTQIPISRYGLNHPKAYIAYAIALKQTHSRPLADALVATRVINATGDARRGACNLDLITRTDEASPRGSGQYRLTDHGEIVVAKALDAYGTVEAAIDEFDNLKGSRARFVELHEVWKSVGPSIAQADPAIAYLISLMQDVHATSGRDEFHLDDLTQYYLSDADADFTVEFFFSHQQVTQDKIHATLQNGEYDVFESADAYCATVTYQLKTLLYHLGVLTERGSDSTRLDPQHDVWALTDRLKHPQ